MASFVEPEAPKILWAPNFQFDSTIDGKAIKTASMIDEHTRLSVMNTVESAITRDGLVAELGKAFAV